MSARCTVASLTGIGSTRIATSKCPLPLSFDSLWPLTYPTISHLNPGGYIEQAELNPVLKSDDGSIVPGDVLDQCGTLAIQAGISLGSSLEVEKSMQDDIARAGFIDVVKTTYKWPVGAWSNDPRLKELGKWNLLHWQQGLESWTLRSFTKRMGVNSSHHFFRPLTRGGREKDGANIQG